MLRFTVFSLLIFLTIGLTAEKAAAQESRQISLQEAVNLVLENNIDIRRARNNMERSEIDVRRATGAFLPNLNATTSANRTTGRQFNQSTLDFDSFTQNTISGQVSTNVPIFTGWQNISNLRSARAERDAVENDFQRLREDMIIETGNEFLQVILNKELLSIAKDNLETSRKQLEQVEAQVEVGMRPIVDQFNQEAVVANNESEVIRQENTLNLSKVRLVRLLQLDQLDDYEFVVPEIDDEMLMFQDYDLTELIELALESRRDIRSREMRLEASEHSLRAARSGYWPTLSFGANINSNYSDQYRLSEIVDGEIQRVTVGFSDQFFDQRVNRSIGFSLNIPIFDRLQTRSNVQNERINQRNLELDLIDTRSQIFQEIRQAYNDYLSFAQELESTEKALIAAEKAFETQQERYNVGSSTLIELTTANNEFVRAASNQVQATYQFVFQRQVLEYFLGRISEEIQL